MTTWSTWYVHYRDGERSWYAPYTVGRVKQLLRAFSVRSNPHVVGFVSPTSTYIPKELLEYYGLATLGLEDFEGRDPRWEDVYSSIEKNDDGKITYRVEVSYEGEKFSCRIVDPSWYSYLETADYILDHIVSQIDEGLPVPRENF